MAKTKTVSGKELHAGDFAYVGDPDDIETWKLPIDEEGRVRDAMARFNQTQGIPSDKKSAVARKIASKAKGMGMDSSNFAKEYAKGSEHADFGNGWVEIFRAGEYGEKGKFDENDLDRVIGSYDPDFHEAPACIGHPADDKPAYGWVDRLKRSGKTLLAKFREVDPTFESAVQSGRFKKRSAAFYLDDTGRIAGLRHVAFLGAQPPEVKGLANLKFDDAGRSFKEVDFEEERSVAAEEKSLKDQVKAIFAEMFGSKKEPGVFSEDAATELVNKAVTAATKPLQEQVTALKTELTTQAQKFAEREQQIAGSETRQRAIEAVNKLKGAGKWVPAFDRMGLPLVFDELAKVTATIEFGEADKDGKKPKVAPLQILAQFLEGLPQMVPGGRVVDISKPAAVASSVHFTEGKNVKADPNSIALNDAATARAKEKNITFGEALAQIAAEKPELTAIGTSAGGQV